MVLRILVGILAVVFLPLGVVFVVIGLVADDIRKGEPETFVYVGAPLAAAGLAFTVAFVVLWRREAARRRRRRQGLRAKAEVVVAEENWRVRVNDRPALNLTVRIAGTTVSGTFISRYGPLAAGEWIEVLYDPSELSNFEPANRA